MNQPNQSKTQKKQEAIMVAKLAQELLTLSPSLLDEAPCDTEILTEIKKTQKIKQFGARRRQVKYLAKLLRETGIEPLLDYMERVKNSKLKQNEIFHRLEELRDRIIHEDEEEQALQEAKKEFPDLDSELVQNLARKYRLTRNQRFLREIFRQLKIAQNLRSQSTTMPPFTHEDKTSTT